MTAKVAILSEAKKAKEDENYNRLVLKAFDDMEHHDKRQILDKKAEVQIAARERL